MLRVDLSLNNSEYDRNNSNVLVYNIADLCRRKDYNINRIISGGLRIPLAALDVPYPHTIGLDFKQISNTPYITNLKYNPIFHIRFHIEYSRSNLTNPDIEQYLYYTPEFHNIDTGLTNFDTIHLVFNDGCEELRFRPSYIRPDFNAGVFTEENHGLQTGDIVCFCRRKYTVNVLNDDEFEIPDIPESSKYEFIVQKYNFNYHIIAHTLNGTMGIDYR